MRVFLLLFICISSLHLFCQNSSIEKIVLKQTFSEFTHKPTTYRKFLEAPKSTIGKLNPLYYLSAGLLYTYQNIISEQIQADCMYEVSCSQYAKLNVQKYGLIRGTLLGFHQLNNCIPSAIYDYPEFKINKNEKIINFK
jgi:putative component of membrane protein insertase Oxa1/YidC/SpoIIIJ protein YidD